MNTTTFNRRGLIRRMAEIDYSHGHRHLGGSLGCLPLLIKIFERANLPTDAVVLSKGHSCSALYAILEALGLHPDVTKPHPEIDRENGITFTTGSLGHGLPLALGRLLAKKVKDEPGDVYVLIGDGEALEGTTWETLQLAKVLGLDRRLRVWVDGNGWQGSCPTNTTAAIDTLKIYPVHYTSTVRGEGVPYFEAHPEWHTHTITPEEYETIKKELA